jgi:protein arginine N-methyltransferase 7
MDATDKYSGAVVGLRKGTYEASEACSVHSTAGVDDILSGDGVLLVSYLDAGDGSLRREAVSPIAAQQRIVQMSQMSSMLRDHWRCSQYALAIKACIAEFQRVHDRAPAVLDIGAGTGLLTLLASLSGASSVVGVEQWPVMCSIAQDVLKSNAALLKDGGRNTHLVAAHSSELKIVTSTSCTSHVPSTIASAPSSTFVPDHPFDIVVSEIVDSSLLGEGMLPALSQAYSELCSTSSAPFCIPRSATLFAQLVNCPLAGLWHCTDDMSARIRSPESGAFLGRTDWSSRCFAPAAAIPVHLKSVTGLRAVSAVFEATSFDFTPTGLCNGDAAAPLRTPALAGYPSDGANAVVFWWNLELWPGICYSTAPGSEATQGWQDHWLQV